MASILPPPAVKYFVAVLYKNASALACARDLFIAQWGTIDFEGADHVFDVTAYYEPEMGTPLLRRIVSFEKLADRWFDTFHL